MNTATDIRLSAVNRALSLLNAAGAKYKVLYNEHEFGELKLAPPEKPKATRKNRDYPHGERTEYCRVHLAGMEISDVRRVPFGAYPKEDIAGVICSTAFDMYGRKAVQVETGDTFVDVLRVL